MSNITRCLLRPIQIDTRHVQGDDIDLGVEEVAQTWLGPSEIPVHELLHVRARLRLNVKNKKHVRALSCGAQ